MSHSRFPLFLVVLLLVCAGLALPAAAAETGWKRYELGGGRYALRYLPASLGPNPAAAPLVVFLHGAGSSPDAWKTILAPHAEALGAVLLMPHSVSNTLGFGPGDDLGTLAAARTALAAEIATDPRRRYLAGFSSGGAFALQLAHQGAGEWAAVLGLGAPYRIVFAAGEPGYPMPTRLVYGDLDPNYTGGSFDAWRQQVLRLGAPLEESILAGVGHGGYPASTFSDGFAFLLSRARPDPGLCRPDETTLCLHDGRFAVRVRWRDFAGQEGPGRVTPARSRESGLFYFFSPDNWELQVKVLDGCGLNQRYWVFAAASTDVGYTLEIRDLAAGREAIYENAVGHVAATVTDIAALATCP